MLYHLFEYLNQHFHFPGSGLFKYITFRAGAAVILSLIISLIIGRKIISFLRKLQIGESVRDLGKKKKKEKEGTPTMGGVIIILSIVVPCLLFCNLNNVYIIIMLISTTWMGIIGFTDDYIKVFKKNKEGLEGKFKILGQIGLGLIVGLTMLYNNEIVVRVSPEVASDNNFRVVKQVTASDWRGNNREMVYVKAPLTNVPFMKGNELNYQKLVGGSEKMLYIFLL